MQIRKGKMYCECGELLSPNVSEDYYIVCDKCKKEHFSKFGSRGW